MPSEKLMAVDAPKDLFYSEFGGLELQDLVFLMFSVANPEKQMAHWFWKYVKGSSVRAQKCSCVNFTGGELSVHLCPFP